MDTRGTIAPKPMKTAPTSTTTTTTGTVHNKEARGGTSHVHLFQGGNNYNSSFNSNFNSNQPPLRQLILGQAKINENINKKILANDKTLESLNVKLETLSSTLKNQLSFNKMIET